MTSAPDHNLHSTCQILKSLMRDTSVERLRNLAQNSEILLHEFHADRKVFAHWMALILISGPQMNVIFKVQFKTQVAQKMAQSIYGIEEKSISETQAGDFVREFCNLVGGHIKNTLRLNQVALQISLPLVVRGFDEIFFQPTQTVGRFQDHWTLGIEDKSLFCSSMIELFEDLILPEELVKVPDGSEIDFF